MNLLRDVAAVLSEEGVNVMSSSTNTGRDGMVRMMFLCQVSDVSHIENILQKLYEVDGVFEARRAQPGETVGKR